MGWVLPLPPWLRRLVPEDFRRRFVQDTAVRRNVPAHRLFLRPTSPLVGAGCLTSGLFLKRHAFLGFFSPSMLLQGCICHFAVPTPRRVSSPGFQIVRSLLRSFSRTGGPFEPCLLPNRIVVAKSPARPGFVAFACWPLPTHAGFGSRTKVAHALFAPCLPCLPGLFHPSDILGVLPSEV